MITKSMRFKRWQGKKASSMQSCMNLASLVEAYLRKVDLPQIRHDVEGGEKQSHEYKQFYEQTGSGQAVLLHCILDIEEAIDLLSTSREQGILKALREDLAALFNDYLDKPNKRIDNILSNFNELLKIDAPALSNLKKAKELYYSIYLSLCIVNRSLAHLPTAAGWIASMYKINTNKLHHLVKSLLLQIEEKRMMSEVVEVQKEQVKVGEPTTTGHSTTTGVHSEDTTQESLQTKKVDSSLAQQGETQESTKETTENSNPVVVEQSLTEQQQAIQKYFDAHYLERITSDASPQEKLKGLLEDSATIKSAIEKFNSERAKEQVLQAKRDKIAAFLKALTVNDTFIVGRQYFTELKKLHEEAFSLLVELGSNPNKNTLLANLKAQEESANSKLTQGFYFFSKVAAPLKILSRALLSEENQEYLASFAPDTPDAEAKRIAKELAAEALAALDQQIKQTKKEQEILNSLAADSKALAGLIAAESSASLAKLAELNTVKESYDDLVAALQIEEVMSSNVKTLIQDLFQQRYARLMHGVGDEKAKVSSIIDSMRTVVRELESLIELQTKKDGVVSRLNSLKALLDVVNKTDNKLIGVVATGPIKELQIELTAVTKQINTVATRLGQGDTTLTSYLIQSSVDSLKELVQINTVTSTLDVHILNAVAPVTVVEKLVPGEKTIQDYFNERYLVLLNHDTHEEERRLANVTRCMDQVDKGIKMVLAAREQCELIVAKEKHMRAVVEVLQNNNANVLLTNLAKERLDSLSKEVLLVRRKVVSLAKVLAANNLPLQTLLLREDPSTLLNVIAANQASRVCIEQFKGLKDSISILNNLKSGVSTLEAYARENNTWWVRLTNFLARFCSIFKSNTGKMIDRANALAQELIVCRKECEQEITSHIAAIKKDVNLGNDLLADLPDRHQYADASDKSGAAFDPNKAIGLLSSVSMFKPKSKVTQLDTPDHVSNDSFKPDDLETGFGFTSCH